MKILHLSDIHFGNHYFLNGEGSSPSRLARIVLEDPKVSEIDLLVVSGDLTWSSKAEEYDDALEFINELRASLPKSSFLVVPGNHDVDVSDIIAEGKGDAFEPLLTEVRQDGFRHWVGSLLGEDLETSFPFFNDPGQLTRRQNLIALTESSNHLSIGVNSAALIGEESARSISTPIAVTPNVFTALDQLVSNRPRVNSQLRVFVLHHHLLPFADPDWGNHFDSSKALRADPTVVADSGHLQTWLGENDFQVVLHGHKHVAHCRVDRLWTRGAASSEREILVLGAGSSGVANDHRPYAEPLSYNVIDAEKTSSGRTIARIFVRRIDTHGGRHRSTDHFSFEATCRGEPEKNKSSHFFQGSTSEECHRFISQNLKEVRLVRNFMSIVDEAGYVHPSSCEFKSKPATFDFVRDACRALQPTLISVDPDSYGQDERRRRTLDGRDMRYQLEHGPRIFGTQIGSPGSSPFEKALRALTTSEGGRRSYIGLFVTERDAVRPALQPPPGLVGLQFHHEDPAGINRLHIVATFRHLELSFWWSVNMFEMDKILSRAIAEIPDLDRAPNKGSITLFAALAAWEADPSAVASAQLDSLSTDQTIELVAGAMNEAEDEKPGANLISLCRILDQKIRYMNILNIETVGLAELSGAIAGLLEPLGVTKNRQVWSEVQRYLDTALGGLDNAILDPTKGQLEVTRSVSSLRDALRRLELLSNDFRR